MRIVGTYIELFNEITGQHLPCGDIYQSDGLEKHLLKHHPDEIELMNDIEDVINSPDYIGKNPKEPESVELVKIMCQNVMVCVKLDSVNNYLYVASVFSINQSKLTNRVKSGRLKPTNEYL